MQSWALFAVVLATALWTASALAACSSSKATHDPALPSGFEDTRLPDVEMEGYLYVDAGRSLSLVSEAFTDAAAAGEPVSLRRMAGIMGQEEDWLGIRIQFASEEEAETARRSVVEAGATLPVQVEAQGPYLSLAWGSEQWANALQGWLRPDEGAGIRERYPEIWEVMQLLPSRPPARPVAAGFARNLSVAMRMLLERTVGGFSGLGEGLPLARLHTTAFAVYAEEMEALPAGITGGVLQELSLGVVAVTRSEYPGPVLSVVLEGIADGGGLERVRIGGSTLYYQHSEAVHLMTKQHGSALYVVLASTREGTQQLVQTVLADWS